MSSRRPGAGQRAALEPRVAGSSMLEPPGGWGRRGRGPDGHSYLPHLWAERPARGRLHPGALSDVLRVLAAPWPRTPAPAAPARRDPAPLHALWAGDFDTDARLVPRLLPVLAPDGPCAPAPPARAAPLPDLRAPRARTPSRPVHCLLPILLPDRPRAPAVAVGAPLAPGGA